MIYALRKLIAFVFLGGIFWFVYHDVERIADPQFQITIAILMSAFAVFWLGVPWVVVKWRIHQREQKNRCGFEQWQAQRTATAPSRDYWHEKGTLYLEPGSEFDALSTPSRIGDVAFPKEPRRWRKIQRVHFYFRNGCLCFKGRELDLTFESQWLTALRVAPGGLVFELDRPEQGRLKLAFTFTNPLIMAAMINRR